MTVTETMIRARRPRLALGPVPYYWPRNELFAFYRAVARSPADIVYLGEPICAKNSSFRHEDWLAVGEELVDAGKEVVLSSLALIEAESELKALRRLCENGRFRVEANDMAAVSLLAGKGEFIAGPYVNIYNPRTLAALARRGLKRWVLPVELSRATLSAMQEERPAGVETEVLAFGRLPLALSARCFTARHHNLPKDDCQSRCLDYPDGLLLSTQEQEPFLALNGIQTQSARTYSLLGELDDIRALGVEVVRILPQWRHTPRILEVFADALARGPGAEQAQAELVSYMPAGPCDGYWQGRPGISWHA